MAKTVDEIITERLFLKGISETDADVIVKWRSNPEVYKFFKAPHQITVDEHLHWYYSNYLADNSRYDWICIEKKSHRRIGVFGMSRQDMKAEINYILAPDAQHKGYATEAVQALIYYASQTWGSSKVFAEIHVDNKSSIALVEKMGFHLISLYRPFAVYEIEV